MTETRPAIPSALRRRVLVEAGHRCAIPTCRYIQVDVHHIIPWETVREHRYENLIALCPNCHQRADRGEIDRRALRAYKANLRFTHDKFSQFEVDVLMELHGLSAGSKLPLPEGLRLLVKRLLDAGYISWLETKHAPYSGGFKMAPDKVEITSSGRQFVDSLGLEGAFDTIDEGDTQQAASHGLGTAGATPGQ